MNLEENRKKIETISKRMVEYVEFSYERRIFREKEELEEVILKRRGNTKENIPRKTSEKA